MPSTRVVSKSGLHIAQNMNDASSTCVMYQGRINLEFPPDILMYLKVTFIQLMPNSFINKN